MMYSDFQVGDRIVCPNCQEPHVALAETPHVDKRDDARCKSCGHIMIRWPQPIGVKRVMDTKEDD